MRVLSVSHTWQTHVRERKCDVKLGKVVCTFCKKDFEKALKHIKYATKIGSQMFCSKECQNKIKCTGVEDKCGNCEKIVYRAKSQKRQSKSGKSFCDRHCATIYHNKTIRSGEGNPNYIDGVGSYRFRAIQKYGSKCMNIDCPISKVIEIPLKMLDVDHIDSDRKNNKIENLQVLCAWCHAIKTREDWNVRYQG